MAEHTLGKIIERLQFLRLKERGALEGMLRLYDANACRHETTHRGGSIWTICEDCGQKWADDRGGFKPYRDPPEVKAARAAITAGKLGT